jgi:hypothetical protein
MQNQADFIATLIGDILKRRQSVRMCSDGRPAASGYALRAQLSLWGLAAHRPPPGEPLTDGLEMKRRRAIADLLRASHHEMMAGELAPPELIAIAWAAVGVLGLSSAREVGQA